MKRSYVAILIGVLAVILVALGACSSTPAPTQPPAAVVATATPGSIAMSTAKATLPPAPTATPPIVVTTPTLPPKTATAKPETTATTRPGTTATTRPQPTATATPSPAIPTPTQPAPTPTPRVTPKYPAPVLKEPKSGGTVGLKWNVVLEWEPVGALSEDEYYHLHMDAYRESDGASWRGDYVYTKETSYTAEGAFLDPFRPPESQGPARVYWWVSVARRTGENPAGKPLGVEISPYSDKWYFILEPKPE
jgi:hypothetical protein